MRSGWTFAVDCVAVALAAAVSAEVLDVTKWTLQKETLIISVMNHLVIAENLDGQWIQESVGRC